MSRLKIPVGKRDHVQGRPDAPISLLEYGDYECSYCGQAYGEVKRIQAQLGEDLQFAFRNFPLAQVHPYALHAALAAEAAALQGRFWEMHDILYEHQEALEDEDLAGYAEALDLDVQRFTHDMQSDAIAERVSEDLMSGVRSGVNGTPTFFINGERHDGPFDYRSLLAAIERKSVHSTR